MKELIDKIQKSIYGPEHYRSLLLAPLRPSIRYYATLTFFLAVFLTIISSIPLVLNANEFVREFPAKFFAYFPDDLEVAIVNGVATTTAPEPYFLPIPAEYKSVSPAPEQLENIAVIDTVTPFSVEQFKAYKSAFWLTKTQMIYLDDSGVVNIRELGKTTNFVLNEQVLRGYEARIAPFYPFVGPIIVLVIFLVLCVMFILKAIYLLLAALLIMLLLRIMRYKVSYGKAYQIGLHAITLPIIVDSLFSLSSLSFMNVRFAPTLILLAVVFVNFRNTFSVTKTDTAPTPSEPT